MSLTAGTRIGAFEILGSLGAGGMGEVYRAHDPRLQREVALKLLPASMAGDDEARGRLLREARAAAALNHPNICTIYEVGETDGQAYIAMEHVEGRSLDGLIPAGGLPARDLFAYGVQIADAVAYAHDKGILHRDLKTANIMVSSSQRVKVLDFGLAKRLARADRPDGTTEVSALVTEPGRMAGTLGYMSPEQLRGQPATASSDVWALGVVLYEMACGQRPFEGTTTFEVASAILNNAPHALPASAPVALRAIVSCCLAKNPADRYQHAGELGAALQAAELVVAPGALAFARRVDARPRRMALWAAAVLIVVAVGFVLITARRPSTPPAGAAPDARIASIAVLPLDNLSGQAEEEYFAAGMQDGLITELARLHALDRVIERRSTRRFAGGTQPVSEVAATLGVDAIVTGSVLRVGDRIRVNAQLIEAATDRHLWAETFERESRDVLSIQSDVARAVATAIRLDLTPDERQRFERARAIDPATYEAYLRGMHLVSRGGGTREDRVQGLAILQEAIDRDPGNAHAYAGLALGYVTLGHGPAAEADAWPKARAAALRAVTLDPNLAEAHSALAEVRMYYEWDWAGAEQSFRRANDLNPNLAMNHYHYAWYHALFSRWDEAIAEHRRAQELDPLTPPHTVHLGSIYLYLGRPDEALVQAKKAIEFAPNAPAAWGVLGRALALKGLAADAEAAFQKGAGINPALLEFELAGYYAEQGQHAKARELVAKLEAQPPTPWSVWSRSQLYVALGDFDGAFKWLAHRPAHAFLPWVRVNPAYVPVRDDPRFTALMREMRLPLP